jgi:FkbM family methyltransferase
VNKLLSTFDSVRYALLPKKYYIKYQARRSSRRHEKELGMLQYLVRPGSDAVDGGAHKGVYSYYLSSLCRYVHAFEPNPAMYEYLCKAVPANVKTHRMALSDYSGKATFNVPCSGSTVHNTRGSLQDVTGENGAHRLEIQVVDLDSMGLENIGFIKLDVEGNEYAAIRGATKLIQESRPVILAELTGVGGNPPEQVVALLEEWDYLPIVTIDGRLRYFGANTSANIRQNCLFLPRENSR